MRLYCLRHGETVSAMEDPERPLSVSGKQAIARLGIFLAKRGVVAHHILHSPHLRTAQTAQLLAQALGTDQNRLQEYPLLAATDGLENLSIQIAAWQDDTILIGHTPALVELMGQLLCGKSEDHWLYCPPGTMVCLERRQSTGLQDQWGIHWVLPPQLLA